MFFQVYSIFVNEFVFFQNATVMGYTYQSCLILISQNPISIYASFKVFVAF